MTTTMISIPPIPFSSTLNEPIHNPLNIDVNLLIQTLQFDYFSCLEVSYTENKTSWFCVSNNTNLNEDELISSLTVHSYEPEFQEVHPEEKQMDFVKLVDFVSQELKSLDDYLQVIKQFNPEGLRSDAINVDNNRHNTEFIKPFVSGKKYPYTKKKDRCNGKKICIISFGPFSKNLGKFK